MQKMRSDRVTSRADPWPDHPCKNTSGGAKQNPCMTSACRVLSFRRHTTHLRNEALAVRGNELVVERKGARDDIGPLLNVRA